MRKIYLAMIAFALSQNAIAQITGFYTETVAVHEGMIGDYDLNGYTTYRLYAELANPLDEMVAVAGVVDFGVEIPFTFNTTGAMFQHPEGDDFGHDNNCGFVQFLPALEFDSWFTVGKSCNDQPGSVQAIASAGIGIELASFVNAEIGGAQVEVSSVDYILFTSVLDVPGEQDENGRVLLGQFTIESSAAFSGGGRFLTILNGVPGESAFQDLLFASDGVAGCTDQAALNYNEDATFDDGTCEYTCFTAEIDAPDVACFGESVIVTITPDSNQIGNLFIGLDGSVPSPADSLTYSLSAGEYVFTLQDENCEVEQTIEIEEPAELVVASTNFEFSEEGLVSANAEGSGGTEPYTFAWYQTDSETPEEIVFDTEDFQGAPQGLYTVIITDVNGCIAEAALNLVGVNEQQLAGIVIRLFPNPAEDKTSLRASSRIFQVELTDAMGRSVKAQTQEVSVFEIELNLSTLESGTYFARVHSEIGVRVLRLQVK